MTSYPISQTEFQYAHSRPTHPGVHQLEYCLTKLNYQLYVQQCLESQDKRRTCALRRHSLLVPWTMSLFIIMYGHFNIIQVDSAAAQSVGSNLDV